jgi:hypothetical protein
MKTLLMVVLAALAGTVGFAQKGGDQNLAGTWEMTVKGPAVHGDLTATMELEQDGAKVTGTFLAHGNRHSVSGEFSDGELSLETSDNEHHKGVVISGKLKEDGTLAGYLSTPMGDMQWTAARVKAQH